MGFENARRCQAQAKSTRQRCKNPAVRGFSVCRMHGAHGKGSKPSGRKPGCAKSAHSGGPAYGNRNNLSHGAYAARMSDEEAARCKEIRALYEQDLGPLSPTDDSGIRRLAVAEAKLISAFAAGAPIAALEVLDRIIHRELKALHSPQQPGARANGAKGLSPAEVLARLLERVRRNEESPVNQDCQGEGPSPIGEPDLGSAGGQEP